MSKIPDMTESDFPVPTGTKARRRRRTQAIAKRYAFHTNAISDITVKLRGFCFFVCKNFLKNYVNINPYLFDSLEK